MRHRRATASVVHQSERRAQSTSCGSLSAPLRAISVRTLAHSPIVAIVVLALATTVAYARCFQGEFISDDVGAVAENPLLRSLSAENLRAIATSFDDVNWIPLKVLSLALDYQVWGLDPTGYHLTNLLLHIANAIAIYWLVLRLGESPPFAFSAALLWALHPVQAESVAWISERKNVLSTLFFLLAFHTYLAGSARPRVRTYLLLFVLFGAALLSKVNTIVLPALALCYEIVWHGRVRARDVAVAGALLAVGVAVAWVNLHGNPSHGVAYHGGSLAVTMRTSSTTISRYLWNSVAPFDLSYYYEVPLRASWWDPPVARAVVLIAGLVALTLWLAWRRRPDAFWLAWFGITLSPMLNLVPFPALMNDRYLYMPVLGILVPALRLGGRLLDRVRAGAAAPFAVGGIACGFALLTYQRVPVFQNELSLWADGGLKTCYISADQPYGARPRAKEIRLLEEAIRRHPKQACLYDTLGGFAFEERRLADALRLLTQAAELDPNHATIALNLGRTQLWLGQNAEAIVTLERATMLEPPSFWAHLNLARAYLRTNDLVRARAALNRAKAIKSEPNFWHGVEQEVARAEARGA
jgi:tetratricopeptide (TPR) repeat protein